MKRIAGLLAIALACLFTSAFGDEMIIESRAEGKNFDRYKEVEGGWIDSSSPATTAKSTAPGLTESSKCGSRKYRCPGSAEQPNCAPAAARFFPKLSTAGTYNVFVTWSQAANATPVTYTIKYAGGEEKKQQTQNGWGSSTSESNANQWLPLGAYRFEAGDSQEQFVEVRIGSEMQTAAPGQLVQVYADAVRFSNEAIGGGGADTQAAPVEPFIIESRPEGQRQNQYQEIDGSWIDSSGKSRAPGLTDPAKCGSRKSTFVTATAGEPAKGTDATARFLPKLEKPGHYFVYVTWPREGNGGPVYYTVKHAKGVEKKTFDQNGWGLGSSSNANIWVPLGEYDFNAGNDQYVEVKKPVAEIKVLDTRNLGQIFADAVQFSPKPLEDAGSAPLPQPVAAAPASTPITLPVLGSPGADTGTPLQWYEDIASGSSAAALAGKKILVFFFSPGSMSTNHYENTVFVDPAVKGVLQSGYVLVRINHQEKTDIAYALSAFKAGTIIIYDKSGSGLKKIDERLSASDFAAELQKLP